MQHARMHPTHAPNTCTKINANLNKFAHLFFYYLCRLLYSHNPDMFNTLTVFRMTFKQNTGVVVFFFCFFVFSASSYSFYVADRGREPNMNWFDWIYFTVITAATVGFGDISPQTSISKVVAMFTSLSGIVLTALLVGAITAALTPSDFQKEAGTWLRMQKQKSEREECSAQFIQLIFRRYLRKKKYYIRNAKEEREYNRKSIRLITHLRHLRKEAQWTKIASTHPLMFQLEELEVKYASIQAELRHTNAKLDSILQAIQGTLPTQPPQQSQPQEPIPPPSSSTHPSLPSPENHPRVLANPPTFK
eukprot:Phypoly_transcript_05562.p1 GENE.Phypoly_transcript_05562~~Phypoly_transcript_05562.p1  ORF type:complete len:305 (-),score=47.27 Phypoly_transcript_05562:70-984(-)